MSDILVSPPLLRWTADQIRQKAESIQRSLVATDVIIKSLGASRIESTKAETLRIKYLELYYEVNKLERILTFFSNDLDQAAQRFEAADRRMGE